VLLSSMGRKWFVGAILIMSAATYITAIFIGTIIEFLKDYIQRIFGPSSKKTRHPGPMPRKRMKLFRMTNPNNSPDSTHKQSEKHTEKEDDFEKHVEDINGAQRRDPKHPKSIEEGKGPGITDNAVDSHSPSQASLERP
jgi:hypothetical protein